MRLKDELPQEGVPELLGLISFVIDVRLMWAGALLADGDRREEVVGGNDRLYY